MLNDFMMIIINRRGIIIGMLDEVRSFSSNSVDELINEISEREETPIAPEHFELLGHLFCARKYAETHYPDMILSYDDMTMYHKLVQRGNILFVNSHSHLNILLAPGETTDEQKTILRDIKDRMNPNTKWAMSDNVYVDTFIQNGQVYGTIEVGDVTEGDIKTCITYLLNKDKVRKINE